MQTTLRLHNVPIIHPRSSRLMSAKKDAERRNPDIGDGLGRTGDESADNGRGTREREAALRRGESRSHEPAARDTLSIDPYSGAAGTAVVQRAFAALAENVRDYGIFLMDPDGVITFWGEGARLIKGWTKAQAEGAHLRLLYPEGGAEDGGAEEHLRAAAETGEYRGEGTRMRCDGSTFWAGVTLTALRDADGTLLGYAKLTRDLTAQRTTETARKAAVTAAEVLSIEDVAERRRAEADLAAIETYAEDIVNTVREPLLILDASLRVRSANRAFYQTFEVEAEETEGHLIYELGNGQWNIPDLRVLLEDIIPMRSVFNGFELEHEFPTIGRRVMLLNARQVRAGRHGELLMLALEDVTERRRAEEEVAEARAAAEDANRSKSQFLANMSHELRTPLNAILGYSEMLQDEAAEQGLDSFDADLERINSAGKHLLALINDILDLSKIEAGKMELFVERFDLAELIDEVAATVQPLVHKNANTLKVVRAAGLGEMRADQMKVRQALYNLLSNAAKFTEGGTITLDVDSQFMDRSEWIVFRVADTGIGLSDEQLSRLFLDFSQADASTTRRFGGTGLGLALTRRFCQLMGGDVSVESILGEGSVFTIKLPVLMQESAPGGGLARAFTPSHPGKIPVRGEAAPDTSYVLVIDDDPAPRERLQRYLSQEGFTVRTAANGAEGLHLARSHCPAAITLDVMMPEMDGWSVLKALKSDAQLRNIPVIMLTMVDDPERGFALGAAEYATKPVDRHQLSAAVRRYVPPGPESLVLMVEDDPATRAMMRNVLAKEGWRVCEAVNGRAGIECMTAERPDLILLDLMMPEMDGFEFADQVHWHPEWRNVPIIVITAHDLSVRDRQRLSGYVETILQKRSDSHESLLSRVRELLDDFAVSRGLVPGTGATGGPTGGGVGGGAL